MNTSLEYSLKSKLLSVLIASLLSVGCGEGNPTPVAATADALAKPDGGGTVEGPMGLSKLPVNVQSTVAALAEKLLNGTAVPLAAGPDTTWMGEWGFVDGYDEVWVKYPDIYVAVHSRPRVPKLEPDWYLAGTVADLPGAAAYVLAELRGPDAVVLETVPDLTPQSQLYALPNWVNFTQTLRIDPDNAYLMQYGLAETRLEGQQHLYALHGNPQKSPRNSGE